MATFFKVTCSVFWVVWMVTMSFTCGMLLVQHKYSYIDTRSELTTIMIMACVSTICMSFLGCLCIKCDITHPCCAIWYIIPTLVTTLILGVMVLVYLRSDDATMSHEEGDVLRAIRKELKASQTIPKFLYYTQVHYGCCGVYGFKDYRAFFLPDSVTQDVPYACCSNLDEGKLGKCASGDPNENPRDTVFDIYLKRTIDGQVLPFDIPSDDEDKLLDPIMLGLYGNVTEHGNAPERYLHPKLNLPVKPHKVANIYLQGCFEHLKRNSVEIYNNYFMFSLFLILSSFVMCVLFAYNCVTARRSQYESFRRLVIETDGHTPAQYSVLEAELHDQNEEAILQALMEKDDLLNARMITVKEGVPETGNRIWGAIADKAKRDPKPPSKLAPAMAATVSASTIAAAEQQPRRASVPAEEIAEQQDVVVAEVQPDAVPNQPEQSEPPETVKPKPKGFRGFW